MGEQQQVVTGLQCPQCCPCRRAGRLQCADHLQVVGDHDTGETEAVAQQFPHQERRLRRGELIAGNRREGEVSAHDCGDALAHQEPVGNQFPLPELRQVRVHLRQHQVGIAVGRTVAREVLGGGHDTGALQAAEERHRQQTGGDRIGTERARADDRCLGVGVHVDGGREVHVDAERGQLAADVAAGLEGITGQASGAQRQVARRDGAGVPDVADPASLLIGGYKQGNLPRLAARRLLHPVDGGGELLEPGDVAGEYLDSSQAALLDHPLQRGRKSGAGVAENEYLRQQLLVAQLAGKSTHLGRAGQGVPEGGVGGCAGAGQCAGG